MSRELTREEKRAIRKLVFSLCANYDREKSYAEVAAAEGVNESAVRHAVERGLKNMKNYLKNCQ